MSSKANASSARPQLWFALAFAVCVVIAAAAGADDDIGTEAPIDVNKVRAFTLDPDDGTEIMLAMPSYEKCTRRMSNAVSIGKDVFWVSNNDPALVMVDPDTNLRLNKTYTWVEGRNECRKKCMDLVTLDNPEKNRLLMDMLESTRITSGLWTAGKRCLFEECESVAEPVHLKGWYWSTTGSQLHPADATQQGWPGNPWGKYGVMDKPQPDNAENYRDKNVIEACLAIKTVPQTQKASWHDVACDRRLSIVCEPAPELLKFIEASHGVTLKRYV